MIVKAGLYVDSEFEWYCHHANQWILWQMTQLSNMNTKLSYSFGLSEERSPQRILWFHSALFLFHYAHHPHVLSHNYQISALWSPILNGSWIFLTLLTYPSSVLGVNTCPKHLHFASSSLNCLTKAVFLMYSSLLLSISVAAIAKLGIFNFHAKGDERQISQVTSEIAAFGWSSYLLTLSCCC